MCAGVCAGVCSGVCAGDVSTNNINVLGCDIGPEHTVNSAPFYKICTRPLTFSTHMNVHVHVYVHVKCVYIEIAREVHSIVEDILHQEE